MRWKKKFPPKFFKESHEANKTEEEIYTHEPLKPLAKEKYKTDDKQLVEEIAKKMIKPFYFTHKVLKAGFNINLDSHHFKQINSKTTIIPIFFMN